MPQIYLTDQAQEDIERLPKQERSKIRKKLVLLEKDLFAGKKLTGKLHGLYSLKVWPCRIIYEIVERHEVWVVHIMHRKDVYRKI